MRGGRLLSAGIGVVLVAGCSQPATRTAAHRPCPGGAADSARAVQIAIDTLGRLDRFRSVTYQARFDSGSFRIVTMPAPEVHRLDGMAIVRVAPDCHVVSLVQTDSA